MTKSELQKEIVNIKQMLMFSSSDRDKCFWNKILKETQIELSKEN